MEYPKTKEEWEQLEKDLAGSGDNRSQLDMTRRSVNCGSRKKPLPTLDQLDGDWK